jgi:hypothetical protein
MPGGAAAATVASRPLVLISTDAPESSSMYANSRADSRVFNGTMIAPSRALANRTSIKAG